MYKNSATSRPSIQKLPKSSQQYIECFLFRTFSEIYCSVYLKLDKALLQYYQLIQAISIGFSMPSHRPQKIGLWAALCPHTALHIYRQTSLTLNEFIRFSSDQIFTYSLMYTECNVLTIMCKVMYLMTCDTLSGIIRNS